jgi:hypothetical protein
LEEPKSKMKEYKRKRDITRVGRILKFNPGKTNTITDKITIALIWPEWKEACSPK